MTRRTKGHPIMPAKMYSILYDKLGEEAATELLDQVQEGSLTVMEVEKMIKEGIISEKV